MVPIFFGCSKLRFMNIEEVRVSLLWLLPQRLREQWIVEIRNSRIVVGLAIRFLHLERLLSWVLLLIQINGYIFVLREVNLFFGLSGFSSRVFLHHVIVLT